MTEDVRRVSLEGLRQLGAPTKPGRKAAAPKRTKAQAALADRARRLLRAEFRKALALKDKMAAESAVGGKEKGRDPGRDAAEQLRALVASLEGMSRFAIGMGILTPAENRAIWADYMRKGLYEGWR